jgi:hypothetical protein
VIRSDILRLTIPEVIVEKESGFLKEVDIFSRREFGDRLSNLIVNSDENWFFDVLFLIFLKP